MEGSVASLYQIMSKSVPSLQRYCDFSNFQDGRRRHLVFLKSQNFIGYWSPEGRDASACQIFVKIGQSVVKIRFFHFSRWRPSAILDLFGAYLDYQLWVFGVSITLQNLVMIDAVVFISRLRIDVHDNDDSDNAWQMGQLGPHGMGPKKSVFKNRCDQTLSNVKHYIQDSAIWICCLTMWLIDEKVFGVDTPKKYRMTHCTRHVTVVPVSAVSLFSVAGPMASNSLPDRLRITSLSEDTSRRSLKPNLFPLYESTLAH